VFKGDDGFWHYKCFVCDSSGGDEIAFLVKHCNVSRREAIRRYLDRAGFLARRPPESREYPKSPDSPESPESLSVLVSECPESPVCLVSPVSNGQEPPEIVRALAARNACKKRGIDSKALFQLVRHLSTVEKRAGRDGDIAKLTLFFDEWHRLSEPFLDPEKTRDDYLAEFLAGFGKVRVLIGEGEILNKALEAVAKLSRDELPVIPAMPNAPEGWRRLAGLHRELSRLCGGNVYFLSYRHCAKACENLSQQQAHTITGALVRLDVIEIVRKGKAGLDSRKAAEFRYLLAQADGPDDEDDEIPV